MVRAYHVIFGTYGFWLPNDPRGSWSNWIGSWELLRYGRATKTSTRRSVAGIGHDCRLRQAGKCGLKYPPVVFNGHQALSIARGLARMVSTGGYVVNACCILPEHVHMVVARHRYRIEQVVRLLKAAATVELANDGQHPLSAWRSRDGTLPTPWARKCWKCFLNTNQEIARAVRYVEQNPIKEGKRPQRWSFVVALDQQPVVFSRRS